MRYSFCPKCGQPLNTRLIDDIERLVCSSCEFVFYQNSKPCASVLVLDQNKLLLVKRAVEPFKDYWDIPGGFLEAGEHPKTGAIREAQEETGLLVELVDDFGVFMGAYSGTDDHTLNFCYAAKVTGGEPRAASDVSQLQWFDLPALPDKIAFGWSQEALELLKQRYAKPETPSKGSLFALPSGPEDEIETLPVKPADLPAAKPALVGGLFGGQTPAKEDSTPAAAPIEEKEKAAGAPSIMRGTLHRAISERVSHSVDTLYVDAAYQGPEKGTEEQPYRTIAGALDRAIAENTVMVAPGVYRERVRLKEKVRLVSQIIGAAVIHGGAERFGGKPVVMGANGAALIGFTVTGGYTGVLCQGASPAIKHNIIRNNYGDYGLACLDRSRAVIQNNTILANLGSETNGMSIGVYVENAEPALYNNIITGNNVGFVSYHSSSVERYNNVWGNRRNFGRLVKPGTGTISVDPRFVDPSLGDYRLQPDSPCRSAGQDPEDRSAPRNMGAFDANSQDAVELPWDNLPKAAKTALQSFPYIIDVQRCQNEKSWESALDQRLGHYWAMPGDELLLRGDRLVSNRYAGNWFAARTGNMGLPVFHFGNIRQRVELDESAVASPQEKSLEQLKIHVPCNAISGWVFIKALGLESNPVYLEIRRP